MTDSKLGRRQLVLSILKKLGREQTIASINTELNMKPKNIESLLSRLFKEGKVERVRRGVYRFVKD